MDFTFSTPLPSRTPGINVETITTDWLFGAQKENQDGLLTSEEKQLRYDKWLETTAKLPPTPLVLGSTFNAGTPTKAVSPIKAQDAAPQGQAQDPAAPQPLQDLSNTAAAGDANNSTGSSATAEELFNRWIAATEATLFTPKREPSTFSPAAAAACTPVWPADIMALQGHPLSELRARKGSNDVGMGVGTGWYVRSPAPQAMGARRRRGGQGLFCSRQPAFGDEPSQSDEEEEDLEGAMSSSEEASEQGRDGAEQAEGAGPQGPGEAASEMAISQLGETMSHLRVAAPRTGMQAEAAVATPISVAMTGGHSPHAPSTPVEEVIGLMLSPQPQPGVGLGAGAQGFVPQQLLFGADAAGGQQGGSAGAASVAQMGPSLGGVYGMGRQESSSDDEVDVASLGFTPLALSACQPATSPMQDLLGLMMSPAPAAALFMMEEDQEGPAQVQVQGGPVA